MRMMEEQVGGLGAPCPEPDVPRRSSSAWRPPQGLRGRDAVAVPTQPRPGEGQAIIPWKASGGPSRPFSPAARVGAQWAGGILPGLPRGPSPGRCRPSSSASAASEAARCHPLKDFRVHWRAVRQIVLCVFGWRAVFQDLSLPALITSQETFISQTWHSGSVFGVGSSPHVITHDHVRFFQMLPPGGSPALTAY